LEVKQLQNKSDTAQELASVIKNSNLSYRELEKMTGLSKTTIKRYADCEIKLYLCCSDRGVFGKPAPLLSGKEKERQGRPFGNLKKMS
jgi:response regulator of citrate/malate metabolism